MPKAYCLKLIALLFIALLSFSTSAQPPKKNFISEQIAKRKRQKEVEKASRGAPARIDGRISNDATFEPLADAFVLLPATGTMCISDEEGYFKMKAFTRDSHLKVVHPDVYDTYYNVFIYQELYTPIGEVRLKPVMIGEAMQADYAYREHFSSSMLATTRNSSLDILAQSGRQDFNNLLLKHAAVDKVDNGGVYGASDLSVRALESDMLQVNFNGISLNDAETGRANTLLYAGIGNWARKQSLTRGAASSALSENASAGLLSIEGFMPRNKAGVDVQFSAEDGNYMQAALGLHSGSGKGKHFATSLRIDGAMSDGINPNTAFETLGAYFTLYAKSFARHQFAFNAAFRYADRQLDSLSAELGNVGLASFHHDYQINKRNKLISTIYAQVEQRALGDSLHAYEQPHEQSDRLRFGLQSRWEHRFESEMLAWVSVDADYYQRTQEVEETQSLQDALIYRAGMTAHIQHQIKSFGMLAEASFQHKNMQQDGDEQQVYATNNYRALAAVSYNFLKNHRLKFQWSQSQLPLSYEVFFATLGEANRLQHSSGVELAYAYRKHSFQWELRGYDYRITGYRDRQSRGVELTAACVYGKRHVLKFSANASDYEQLCAENRFHFGRDWSLTADYRHNFGEHADCGVLGAELSRYKDFKREGSRLQIYAACRNLLDAQYSNTAYSIMPRQWSLGVRYVL